MTEELWGKERAGMSINNKREYPPFRVYWNWELTHECNYQCSYCQTWSDTVETPKIYSVDEWKKVWDRIYDLYSSCVVRFSGGEPSVYPNFVEMVGVISQNHSVDVTTNLSFDTDNFLKKVKPGCVAISASFHPEYNKIEDFLKKVLILHHNGYISTICVVAYPPFLDKLGHFKKTVESENIMFKFIPFTGTYKGKEYPKEYTGKERELMEMTAKTTKDETGKKLNENWVDWNANKRDSDEGVKTGKICFMGVMYAKIHTDGRVTRCCGEGSQFLGNIVAPDFKLLDEPLPCDVEHCPCFKAMLFDEKKWGSLWEALPHEKYTAKSKENKNG